MTTNEIKDWLPHLTECPYFKHSDGQTMVGAEREVAALNDPAFGWHVATAHAREAGAEENGTPISILMCTCSEVLTAYHYLSEKCSGKETLIGCEAIQTVDNLLHPANASKRAVLNALLMAPNASFNVIAAWMNLDEEVIHSYSHLVFNVRDRLGDHPFINRILYPDGRTSRSGHDTQIPYELKLLRTGREKGGQEVLLHAGYDVDEQSEGKSSQQQLQALESAIIANAATDLRLGDTDSPALKQVRPLLAAHAENREANNGAIDDMKAGLGAVGLGLGIIATVKRIQGPDIAKRLNMPSQEEIAAARKKFNQVTV